MAEGPRRAGIVALVFGVLVGAGAVGLWAWLEHGRGDPAEEPVAAAPATG